MNSYYFSHDYSARSDFKIKKLLQKHGILGYGVFWAIVEELYLNANALPTDYNSIAYELRIDVAIVKSIINDFELFEIVGDYFGSMSVQRRIDEREQKSENARKAARIRWGNKEKNANAMPTHTEGNAINKIKEIKSNKENKDVCVSNENELFTTNTQLQDLKKEDTDTHLVGAIAKPKFDFRKALLSLGANKLHVDEWMTIRNKKKAVNSEYAFATFLKELEKSGQHIDEVLRLCCQKQWRGFEASWITELPPKIEVKKSLASEIRNGI